jgi:DNA topoisomerase-3
MKLCLAEKPSVAKDLAKILGANSRKDGYYEGNGYLVSWTFGHLCTLKEPGDYTEVWKKWNLDVLPMLPPNFGIKLKDDSGIIKQFKTIERLTHQCEEVINCGDAGQEGELIQRWVLAKAKCQKPLQRLWISSLTEESIKEGFNSLKPGEDYNNLYAAGLTRAVGDWVLGMNATRAYTLKFAEHKQILSIGRVQTPTLALIVQRQHEINNFKSEVYYEIKTVYRDVLFSSSVGKIKEKEKGANIMDTLKQAPFEVVSYTQKEGKESPPSLFDLTSLQVEGNKKFGLTAEETLNIVQKLYEQKLVTYPRVDTTYLSDDIYPKVEGTLRNLTNYAEYTTPLLGKPIKKSKKVFNNKKVTDHHAIIPTGVQPSGLPEQFQKVYDTITRRFIAVFHDDCKVSNTTVIGKVTDVEFKATGKQILSPGWRVLYAKAKLAKDKNEENVMPSFEKGESGPHEPELQEKNTKAPSYFTEASLLRAMETAGKQVDDQELRELMKENGIGRPSTRANIIETLFRRNYIVRQKKRILATSTGMHLISLIEDPILKSAELTGVWEKKLRDIERGEFAVDDFKTELFDMVNQLVHQVKHQRPGGKNIPCPKCNIGSLIRGKAAWGCSDWKNGCKFTIPYEFKGIILAEKDIESLVYSGESHYKYQLKKTGNKQKVAFNAKFSLTAKAVE